jgi:adenylate cyclase class 2
MQAIETEIKIRLVDCELFEQSLCGLGFTQETTRTFERNTLYDTADRKLRQSRQILRVRDYGGKWTVTHKTVPEDDDPSDRHKRRIETETVVEDGRALSKIFESLGLEPVFVYEKWRTEWTDGTGHCVIDETPLGPYAEIEGPGDWIDSTARKMQLKESEFIKLSYGRLFEAWREQSKSKAQNLSFSEIPPGSRAS